MFRGNKIKGLMFHKTDCELSCDCKKPGSFRGCVWISFCETYPSSVCTALTAMEYLDLAEKVKNGEFICSK